VEKLKMGIWVQKPPQGYDIVKINNERKIVVNKEGKILKKAFELKLKGLALEEIVEKVNAMGLKTYRQQLHKIFCNPFYCGLITHGLLNGEVVEARHEAIVSKEDFLKVNNIIESSPLYGVPHNSKDNHLPLKVFVRCTKCGGPYTGYVVKKKGIYYYKCRTKGCKCNKNANEMNNQFVELLKNFEVKEELKAAVLLQLEVVFKRLITDRTDEIKKIKTHLAEITNKIDMIEEKYFVLGEMNKETFEKFHSKYKSEQDEVLKELYNYQNPVSNSENILEKAVSLCENLHEIWASGNVRVRERIQKLVFPEGILYDKEKDAFRTDKINSIFYSIARTVGGFEEKKKGTNFHFLSLSPQVELPGFEPGSKQGTKLLSTCLAYY